MAYPIRETYETEEGTAVSSESKNQAQVALHASLGELEEMFGSLLTEVEGTETKTSTEVLDEVLEKLTANFRGVMDEDPVKGGEMIARFTPFFDRLGKNNPQMATQIQTSLTKLFQDYAVANGDNAGKLLEFLGGLGKAIPCPPAPTSSAPPEDTGGSEEATTEIPTLDEVFNAEGLMSLADLFANLTLSLQEMETKIMENNAHTNILLAEAGDRDVDQAQHDMEETIDKINDMLRAIEKAAKASKWGFAIQIGVAVAGIALASLTLGVGGVLVMAAMTAFMMSPAYQKTIEGLSGLFGGGRTGDALAKTVVLVAVVVISGGIGYASAGTAAAEEGAEVVAQEGAEEGANAATTAGTSAASKAASFAEFQFWGNLAAINPFEEAWRGRVSKDMEITLSVMTAVLSMVMLMRPSSTPVLGASPATRMMQGGVEASAAGKAAANFNGEEWLAVNYTKIARGLRYSQAVFSAGEATAKGLQAHWQYEQAAAEEAIAELNAESQMVQALISMNNKLQTSNTTSMSTMLDTLESALRVVSQDSGRIERSVAYAIARG